MVWTSGIRPRPGLPLIVLKREEMYTVPVALSALHGLAQNVIPYGEVLAGATLGAAARSAMAAK